MKEYKKINCDHIVMKQITKDEDIINFASIIPASMLAFRFIMKCQDIITIDHVLKFDYNVKLLGSYAEKYIRDKEKTLGKRRVLFTEEELKQTFLEIEGLYKMFREQGLVY